MGYRKVDVTNSGWILMNGRTNVKEYTHTQYRCRYVEVMSIDTGRLARSAFICRL